jgi:hypothetical protein
MNQSKRHKTMNAVVELINGRRKAVVIKKNKPTPRQKDVVKANIAKRRQDLFGRT